MDFTTIMKQWRRMCDWSEDMHGEECCDFCPVKGKCGAIYEVDNATDWSECEQIIIEWAQSHPEPIYPTWGEWFVQNNMLISGWDSATNIFTRLITLMNTSISPSIAKKLSISPKES